MDMLRRRDVAAAERFAEYRDEITQAFVPLEAHLDSGSSFRAQVRSQDIGALTFSDISASEHIVNRSAQTIRSVDPGHLKLGLQVSGYTVLTQDGREAALVPGDLALYDTSRPYSLAFAQDYRMIVVVVPRALLRLPERPLAALTATRISGRQGIGAFLSPLLLRLSTSDGSSDPTVTASIGNAVLDLLTATLAQELQDKSAFAAESHQRTLLLQTQGFISGRLGDADLTPTLIADAHHISVRYLHRLFEAEGETVNGWIRRLRLEHCRRDLADPRMRDVSVSSIGAKWGLPSAAHFSRVFSATYDSTPSAYRAQLWESH